MFCNSFTKLISTLRLPESLMVFLHQAHGEINNNLISTTHQLKPWEESLLRTLKPDDLMRWGKPLIRHISGSTGLTLFFDLDFTFLTRPPLRNYLLENTRSLIDELAQTPNTNVVFMTAASMKTIHRLTKMNSEKVIYGAFNGHLIKIPGSEDFKKPINVEKVFYLADFASDTLEMVRNFGPGALVEHLGSCVLLRLDCFVNENHRNLALEAVKKHAEFNHLNWRNLRHGIEVSPITDWNKGHAALHILQTLNNQEKIKNASIYIGDISMDKDTFLTIKGTAKSVRIGGTSDPEMSDITCDDMATLNRSLKWLKDYKDQMLNNLSSSPVYWP